MRRADGRVWDVSGDHLPTRALPAPVRAALKTAAISVGCALASGHQAGLLIRKPTRLTR